MRKAGIAEVEKAIIRTFGGTWEREVNSPGNYHLTKYIGKFMVRFSRRNKHGIIKPGFDWGIIHKNQKSIFPSFCVFSGGTKNTHQEAIRELELRLKDLASIVKNMKGD